MRQMGLKLLGFLTAIAVGISIFLLGHPPVPTQAQVTSSAVNEVLVRFHALTPPLVRQQVINGVKHKYGQEVEEIANQAIRGELAKLGVITLRVPKNQAGIIARVLSQNFFVEYAEPNFRAEKMMISNDPRLFDQWGVFKIKAADSSTSAWDS